MDYQWIIKKRADLNKIRKLSQKLNNIHPALSNLLIERGIDDFDKAKNFFRPKLENLHNPFLMKDMQKAVNRLQLAIDKNEKILVYGDYDVDGTTSVALVFNFLKNFYKNLDFYIPDRYTEGYGISTKGIDFAAENNYSLVIALDCGIKAVEKIEYANKKQVNFIICDHHTPGDNIPKAAAVLNPKQKDCKYPYKELSGCGVGFKFMLAFAQKNNLPSKKIFNYLDLVAISIASDIVPITGENRILEFFGIKQILKTKLPGLKALKEIAEIKNDVLSVSDIVFKIGPRINAAGRMQHAKLAVNLLIEQDINNAREIAGKINEYNSNRKYDQNNITNEVLKIFEQKPDLKNKLSTVVYNENWSKGIIGIVASKVIEKFYKPTIILTKTDNKWTGSARSVGSFDLYKAINSCNNLLDSFGGHKYAAGLTVEDDKLHKFINCFEQSVSEKISKDEQFPKLEITDILKFSDINDKFIKILKQFAPFGPENMRPVFVTFDVIDTGYSRTIGKKHEHLKLQIKDKTGRVLSAVAFGKGYLFDEIKRKRPFDICYTITENIFNGKKTVKLEIKDIKIKA